MDKEAGDMMADLTPQPIVDNGGAADGGVVDEGDGDPIGDLSGADGGAEGAEGAEGSDGDPGAGDTDGDGDGAQPSIIDIYDRLFDDDADGADADKDAGKEDDVPLYGPGTKYATAEEALKSIPERDKLIGAKEAEIARLRADLDRAQSGNLNRVAADDPDAARESVDKIEREQFNRRVDLTATLLAKGEEGLRPVIRKILAEEAHAIEQKRRITAELQASYSETWDKLKPAREKMLADVKAKKMTLDELIHLATEGRAIRDARYRAINKGKTPTGGSAPTGGGGGSRTAGAPGKKGGKITMADRTAGFDADMSKHGALAGVGTTG